jgi:hypothetical protein
LTFRAGTTTFTETLALAGDCFDLDFFDDFRFLFPSAMFFESTSPLVSLELLFSRIKGS